jgi:hypothetical protein
MNIIQMLAACFIIIGLGLAFGLWLLWLNLPLR